MFYSLFGYSVIFFTFFLNKNMDLPVIKLYSVNFIPQGTELGLRYN